MEFSLPETIVSVPLFHVFPINFFYQAQQSTQATYFQRGKKL